MVPNSIVVQEVYEHYNAFMQSILSFSLLNYPTPARLFSIFQFLDLLSSSICLTPTELFAVFAYEPL